MWLLDCLLVDPAIKTRVLQPVRRPEKHFEASRGLHQTPQLSDLRRHFNVSLLLFSAVVNINETQPWMTRLPRLHWNCMAVNESVICTSGSKQLRDGYMPRETKHSNECRIYSFILILYTLIFLCETVRVLQKPDGGVGADGLREMTHLSYRWDVFFLKARAHRFNWFFYVTFNIEH